MADFGNDFAIKVDTGTLRTKADTVSNQISTMEKQLDELKQTVTRTADYWIGNGGDARRNEYIEKQAIVEEMIRRLKEYPVDLLQMAGVYERAEKETTQIPQSLSADMII